MKNEYCCRPVYYVAFLILLCLALLQNNALIKIRRKRQAQRFNLRGVASLARIHFAFSWTIGADRFIYRAALQNNINCWASFAQQIQSIDCIECQLITHVEYNVIKGQMKRSPKNMLIFEICSIKYLSSTHAYSMGITNDTLYND